MAVATTNTIRWARVKLVKLQRDYKHAIGDSRTAHGKWEAARKTGTQKQRDAAYAAWKATVKKAHDLGVQVSRYSTYVNKGAQTASLDVAKAIAQFEGGRSSDGLFHPYKDPAGVWTIGYGHTGGVSAQSKPLTAGEATTLLLHDLNVTYAPAVKAAFARHKWKPNQKMFDALVSFFYNLGTSIANPGSSIDAALGTHNVGLTAHTLLLYVHAGSKVLPGLVRRRQWEGQLFKGGTYRV